MEPGPPLPPQPERSWWRSLHRCNPRVYARDALDPSSDRSNLYGVIVQWRDAQHRFMVIVRLQLQPIVLHVVAEDIVATGDTVDIPDTADIAHILPQRPPRAPQGAAVGVREVPRGRAGLLPVLRSTIHRLK